MKSVFLLVLFSLLNYAASQTDAINKLFDGLFSKLNGSTDAASQTVAIYEISHDFVSKPNGSTNAASQTDAINKIFDGLLSKLNGSTGAASQTVSIHKISHDFFSKPNGNTDAASQTGIHGISSKPNGNTDAASQTGIHGISSKPNGNTDAGEKCVTPNHEEAECVSIYSCQILIDALKTKESEAIEFVRKSKCEGRELDRMVCCGSTSRLLTPMINKNADKDKLLPDRRYCGYQHSDDYFRNETAIGINEFPWVAGLLYKRENANGTGMVGFSGSLISNRYVLTSATSITLLPYEYDMNLVGVRLGEYNIKTDEDCTEDSGFYECSESPQNIGIEKMIVHPEYRHSKDFVADHNIGLLRLSKRVQYSDYIRPICLPTAGTMFAKPGDVMLSSGWGTKTHNGTQTETKKKISSKLITNEECAAAHKVYEKFINVNHLCTKELEDNTAFSCAGDLGAPVIFSFRNQWHQEGILLVGFGCNGEYPRVSTKVVNYLDWIKESIEP